MLPGNIYNSGSSVKLVDKITQHTPIFFIFFKYTHTHTVYIYFTLCHYLFNIFNLKT